MISFVVRRCAHLIPRAGFLIHCPLCEAPIIGRTKRDNLLAALIGLSSLRISNRRYAHGSK